MKNGNIKINAKMKFKIGLLLFILGFSSCRTEEIELIQANEDEVLVADSNAALLVQRTASNDGSIDNIIDRANCFEIIFPYSVNANGQLITLNSNADFAIVECVFDETDDDIDALSINYPVTIRFPDFSEIQVNTIDDLTNFSNSCNGENIVDDDIECIDFQFPVIASIFNSNSELLDTLSLESDSQLYNFVVNIDENDIVGINFPINVTLADNSTILINDINALEIAITNAINACDEDDDFDYNEDDCDDCTLNEIADLLTSCEDWNVNILRRENNTNYDDLYDTYEFNFFDNGTMSVFWNTTTVTGTWVASGTGNAIEVIIDVPDLPLCNNDWILREIKNCSTETEVDFRLGIDRIQYIKNCN